MHISKEPDDTIQQEFLLQLQPNIGVTWGTKFEPQHQYKILISGRPTESDLAQMPYLDSVIVPYAGVPQTTIDMVRAHPEISLHNLHHNASPTAETGLALLFAAAKYIVPFDRKLRQGDWSPRYAPSPAILLRGKSILILGYGSIGQIIGKVCQALGMNIMAIRKSIQIPSIEPHDPQIFPPTYLHAILPKTNVLMICLPLTPDTENMIDQKALALLPSGSILVNIGRGLIVNEDALYENLENGHLAAAGLDVWYQYPESIETRSATFPSRLPLQKFDNLVMSPHRGGASRDTEKLRYTEIARYINMHANGEPMPNQVDLERGY